MKTYLGDGVYVEDAGLQFRLYTQDGMEIYLDPGAIAALVEFAKKCSGAT